MWTFFCHLVAFFRSMRMERPNNVALSSKAFVSQDHNWNEFVQLLWGKRNHNFLIKRLESCNFWFMPALCGRCYTLILWSKWSRGQQTELDSPVGAGCSHPGGHFLFYNYFYFYSILELLSSALASLFPWFPLSSASAVVVLLRNQEWETLRWGRNDKNLPNSTGIPLTLHSRS